MASIVSITNTTAAILRPKLDSNFTAINTELVAATTAVALKASSASLATHTADVANPHSVTKTQVGLSNVDNTSNATERAATATLTNKSISGSSNTLTNLPAAGILGVIPIANLATGTPTGAKFLRDDGTLAVPAGGGGGGGGDALVANPLSQFAATTSAQLRGVLSDETGTGAAVFGTSPNITTPTGIVKNDVGLGSVDNTADTAKPVSTAQATAIALKVPLTYLDTDTTLAANSDTKIATQKAVKAYADSKMGKTGSYTTNNLLKSDGSGNAVDAGAVALNGVTTSAGAGDVGKIQVLDANGLHDASTLPALTGDVTKAAGSGVTVLPTVNSNVGAFTNANITVNAKGQVTSAANGSGGGGSGGDVVTTLINSPVTITATTTLDATYFGKVVYLAPTSADITVTLPTITGNSTKSIFFIVTQAATKTITLDGNSSETIDGATTRILWKGEAAHLLVSATEWNKIAGRTIPMTCTARYSTGTTSTLSYAQGVAGLFSLTVAVSDPAGLFSSGDSAIKIKRPGVYNNVTMITAGDNLTADAYWQVSGVKNGSTDGASVVGNPTSYAGAAFVVQLQSVFSSTYAVNDLIKGGYYTSESGKTSRALAGFEPFVSVEELPLW